MVTKININKAAMSDGYLVEMISHFIKQTRLNQNKSQAKLAEEASINRASLIKIESGKSCSTLTLIQLLRALKALNILEVFTVETVLSPIQLAELEQAKRKRASKQKEVNKKTKLDW